MLSFAACASTNPFRPCIAPARRDSAEVKKQMADLETRNRTLAVSLKQSEESYRQKLAAAEVSCRAVPWRGQGHARFLSLAVHSLACLARCLPEFRSMPGLGHVHKAPGTSVAPGRPT
jgi:hypothetical protein